MYWCCQYVLLYYRKVDCVFCVCVFVGVGVCLLNYLNSKATDFCRLELFWLDVFVIYFWGEFYFLFLLLSVLTISKCKQNQHSLATCSLSFTKSFVLTSASMNSVHNFWANRERFYSRYQRRNFWNSIEVLLAFFYWWCNKFDICFYFYFFYYISCKVCLKWYIRHCLNCRCKS